ncbi:MAG: response regulator transcription factor [Hyphomicrobium sp.]|nr:response regulator transcription factor [Hyphomicrobium sp.]
MARRLIRIAIFDDHAAIRQAWMRALASVGGFDVLDGGASASDAIDCGKALLPDLIVLDMQMPGGGLEAVRQLYREAPYVKTVVLSSDDSEHHVSAAFASGAFGFMTKGQPLVSVISDLQAIANGQSQFSAGLARALVSPQGIAAPWREADDPGGLTITAKEEQILSRYGQGLTVGEIASSIGVSPRTVASTFTNILHKLHEHTLFEAALAADDPDSLPGSA